MQFVRLFCLYQTDKYALSYLAIFLLPTLKQMSSRNLLLQSLSASTFALLVKLLPVTLPLVIPKGLNKEQHFS